MRIDKFLKNARIIKRRTVAKEACEGGRVKVNGKTAKPGTEVEVGDELVISLGQADLAIRVKAVPEHVTKEMADTMYEVLEDK